MAVLKEHDYEIKSNSARYFWQCSKCSQIRPYPSEPDDTLCPGAPCLCAYGQFPNPCKLHGSKK